MTDEELYEVLEELRTGCPPVEVNNGKDTIHSQA
jgi:hypothetical protein